MNWEKKKKIVTNYPSDLKSRSAYGTGGDDDYLGEEEFTVEQVGQLHQALLHRLPPTLLNVQVSPQRRLPVAGEENALSVHPIVKEGDARAHQVAGHVHHLCHQVWVRVEEEGWKVRRCCYKQLCPQPPLDIVFTVCARTSVGRWELVNIDTGQCRQTKFKLRCSSHVWCEEHFIQDVWCNGIIS